MINIDDVFKEVADDVDTTTSWAEHLYLKSFASYFSDVKDLYKSLSSKKRPITDTELEEILTTLPLQLITVSEVLSQFKISKEVVTLTLKQKEAEHIRNSSASSATQKKEEAALAVLEYKLVQTVYSTVINRVENEISFSRELIMSAKKIWDARRSTDNVNPTGNVTTDRSELPDYAYNSTASVGGGQTYIK